MDVGSMLGVLYCTTSLTGGACPVQEITVLEPQDGKKAEL
jgi:hypothetical protein